MNITEILWILFYCTVFTSLFFAAMSLIGASLYDFELIRREHLRKKFPQSIAFNRKPLISVLVPAYNEELVIERTLSSIIESQYTKYEVIVIDDASKDQTTKLVQKFIKAHPEVSIRIIKRQKHGKGANLNYAHQKYAKGELVMTLDADCILDPTALQKVVYHFSLDPTVGALAANVRLLELPTILGLLQRFEYMSSFRSKKFFTLANSEYIIGGAGATYRRTLLEEVGGFDQTMKTEDIAVSLSIAGLGNKANRLVYASDVIVTTEPVMSFKSLLSQRYRWKFGNLQAVAKNKNLFFNNDPKYSRMLVWLRLPTAMWSELMLIVEPMLFVYLTWASIHYRSVSLFIGASVTLTFYLLFTIWGDEHLSLKNRLKMTLLAPAMYAIFYIMTMIQVISIFKCLKNIKGILGRINVQGTWISPERLGNKAGAKI